MLKKLLKYLKKSIDFIILILVIAFLIHDLMGILTTWIEATYNFFFNYDFIHYMVNNTTETTTTTTHVQILHDDGTWSNTIKSIFIYGTGALRISLLRGGGTPASRAFVIATTIGADTITRFANNTVNNPDYMLAHYKNWKAVWNDAKSEVTVRLGTDTETIKEVDKIAKAIDSATKKFTNGGNGLEDFANKLLSYIMDILTPILQPVKVAYSNELLSIQLHSISILLFILCVLIIILLVAFFFNLLVFIQSDRISNYFTNKYIKWYVNFNKKIIGIELLFLGSTILYFMCNLAYGIHFLATHPITFN